MVGFGSVGAARRDKTIWPLFDPFYQGRLNRVLYCMYHGYIIDSWIDGTAAAVE